MSDHYQSPDLDPRQVVPVGPCIVSYPWHRFGDLESLEVTQVYYQLHGRFRPLALNTPIDISQINLPPEWDQPRRFSEAVLVEESEPYDAGAGLRRFERTWIARPLIELVGDPVAEAVTYPGAIGESIIDGKVVETKLRDPFTMVVPVRLRLRYYLVGVGGDVASRDDLPIPLPFRVQGPEGVSLDVVTHATLPSLSQYGALIDDGNYNFALGGQPSRYKGNIYEIANRLAQYR